MGLPLCPAETGAQNWGTTAFPMVLPVCTGQSGRRPQTPALPASWLSTASAVVHRFGEVPLRRQCQVPDTRPVTGQTSPPIRPAGLLRALRRRADLSQRELSKRAGIPDTTIADIESGSTTNPRFGTVERLVRAAGAEITITFADGTAIQAIETDELRDGGGRRYPAHLDVRTDYTFSRQRRRRDWERWEAAGEQPARLATWVRRLRPGDERLLDPMPLEAAMRHLADRDVQHWIVEYEFEVRRVAAHLVTYSDVLDTNAGLLLVQALVERAGFSCRPR